MRWETARGQDWRKCEL